MLPIRPAMLMALLLCFLTACSSPSGSSEPAAGPPPEKYSLQLGPEQRVYGPGSHVDIPFYTVESRGLKTYIANGDTYEAEVEADGQLGQDRLVLPRGKKGSFDQCGSWLTAGVVKDPKDADHWVTYYHAEATRSSKGWCVWTDGATLWSLAYAESHDAGKTWQKGSTAKSGTYPDNQVLTQDTALSGDDLTEDAGNGRVVVRGKYLYLLYMASTRESPNRRLNIARSPLKTLGAPGTWSKYYCSGASCGFTEPGIGGRSTALARIEARARHIQWSSYLGRWLAFSASGRDGFRIVQSKDLIHWGEPRDIYPAVTSRRDETVDKWGARDASTRALYGYGSLVRADLEPKGLGKDFYLYYMKVYPGQGTDKRYLLRRKVTIVPGRPVADRVELSTYRGPEGQRLTSTEMPLAGQGYQEEASSGYVLSDKRDGFVELFDCQGRDGDQWLASKGCGSAHVLRRVGWISPKPHRIAPVKLLGCFDPTRRRHFATTQEQSCFREKQESVIGYVMESAKQDR